MVASIEYIERVIATYERATEANWNQSARTGNQVLITADSADDVMITGDLHGNRPNFNAIKKIARLNSQPGRHLILQEVCHGGPTYPKGGGCMSHTMLEDVAKLKDEYPERVHFILSNHEMAELTDYPISKGQKMLNLVFRYGLQEVYGPAAERVREAYLPFIKSCPLTVRLPGDVVVSHSAPENVDQYSFDSSILDRPLEPLDYQEHQPLFKMLWGRDYRPENAEAFARLAQAKVLIHGHDPCREGFKAPNDIQIILDCCSKPASYVIVPTEREFTHEEILARVQMLP